MRITLAKSAGFCFGVKRALDIALKTSLLKNKVYMLGDIVHNEDVVKRIENAGIKKVKHLRKTKGAIMLIRAHGASMNIFQKASKLGYKIVDATCPMVKEIHKIAKEMENKNYKIIVIGDKNHDEVRGIIGQLKKRAIVIDTPAKIPLNKIKEIKKACILVQSTQNLDKALKTVAILKKYIPDLIFFNTICKPTRTKQEEIKAMPLENDSMIIIGSKNSANTKRLYEISRSLNKKTWWVNSKRDIKNSWFKNTRSIGITAGASTPQDVIEDILNYIPSLPSTQRPQKGEY
ncbi:MAG: 4-hydroxy-3-methylbut-2-enyl diphosphate reductase [Candidatus Omnitrophica bacterium]|jgi:4-hydroxy-3-methylbut-2-enyl diphosphate reductase|nr:4-hydroxy-3-methylbut-2-enyl diphosphate reductase [Candidatus Omnitrophota bacterium]